MGCTAAEELEAVADTARTAAGSAEPCPGSSGLVRGTAAGLAASSLANLVAASWVVAARTGEAAPFAVALALVVGPFEAAPEEAAAAQVDLQREVLFQMRALYPCPFFFFGLILT